LQEKPGGDPRGPIRLPPFAVQGSCPVFPVPVVVLPERTGHFYHKSNMGTLIIDVFTKNF
jgi:hypothetical protein